MQSQDTRPYKIRNSSTVKRKQLSDISNIISSKDDQYAFMTSASTFENKEPIKSDTTDSVQSIPISFQNKHPLLAWYKHDFNNGHMSYDEFRALLQYDNDANLITFLMEHGLISKQRPCMLCGGNMRTKKDGNQWFWICTRRVNGVKCNRGKKSIRHGTIFENSKLSIQTILTLMWHYVHHMSEKQCAEYTNISDKNNTSVVKWYKFCRQVCTDWFWDPLNTPKLGGFGKIVEMDESFFPGNPKFNRGRRLGEGAWQDDEKWLFGMTERGSLDAIAVQVPSNRSRLSLMPHVNAHCLPGTIFCSDGWKAYHKLAEHLELDDVLHYSVNHPENFVDPDTRAHTQTIEGFWRHCKSYLPSFGLKPKYLKTYIGGFLWHRYCKQRDLDMFLHLLQCISEKRPFVSFSLPAAQMDPKISENMSSAETSEVVNNIVDTETKQLKCIELIEVSDNSNDDFA